MANKPTQPNFPLGLVSAEQSSFLQGLLNDGTLEHGPNATMTVPENSQATGEISAIRYNPTVDEFEGYFSNGWRTLGGTSGRWYLVGNQTNYNLAAGRAYFIDVRTISGTLNLPTPAKVGDSITIMDMYGAFSTRPLTVNGNGRNIYGAPDNMVLSTASMAATFTWTGAAQGWVITSGVGLGQGRVYNRVVMKFNTNADTDFITLNYKPEFLDIYVAGLRLTEDKYSVANDGIHFNPVITSGQEVQIIEYTPVNLASVSGTTTYEVASESEMLALVANKGDIALRTDLKATYRLKTAPSNVLSNWSLISIGVLKVNGRSGNVTVAEAGENNDITRLTALQGPLRLGGDAADPYDAVTLRQLQASSGGGGATMNGVMNNFIGAVEWFNGTRAALPPGYIPADGQEVTKAAWPDLWMAVANGFLVSVTQANWTANRNLRANYANDTSSTSFRVPDLNGQQSGSVTGAFLRGHSSVAEAVSGAVGEMRINGAPEAVGTAALGSWSAMGLASGVFRESSNAIQVPSQGTNTAMTYMTFALSRGNAAYGRDGTSEVRPNSAVGIWIIRASAAFQAVGTNFNVITSDAAVPALNTIVQGGSLRSLYYANGNIFASASMSVKVAVGQKPCLNLTLADNNGKSYPYQIGGTRYAGGPIPLDGLHYTWKEAAAAGWLNWNPGIVSNTGIADPDRELMVAIYPDRIHIKGIARLNAVTSLPAGAYAIYSVAAMLPGKTKMRKPFGLGIASTTTGMISGFTRTQNTLGQDVTFETGTGGAASIGYIVFDDTIYFDD